MDLPLISHTPLQLPHPLLPLPPKSSALCVLRPIVTSFVKVRCEAALGMKA